MVKMVAVRLLVPTEDNVRHDVFIKSLQASLRKRGITRMDADGQEEPADATDALLDTTLIFWNATDVRRGPETRGPKKAKAGGENGG